MGNDPKEDLVDLLQGDISPGAITDDDGNRVTYLVLFGRPPYTSAYDLLVTQGHGVVISVDRKHTGGKRVVKSQPLEHHTILAVEVWVTEKAGITADKLKWKTYEEIRRVLRSDASYQRMLYERNDDHENEGYTFYEMELWVLHKTFALGVLPGRPLFPQPHPAPAAQMYARIHNYGPSAWRDINTCHEHNRGAATFGEARIHNQGAGAFGECKINNLGACAPDGT